MALWERAVGLLGDGTLGEILSTSARRLFKEDLGDSGSFFVSFVSW